MLSFLCSQCREAGRIVSWETIHLTFFRHFAYLLPLKIKGVNGDLAYISTTEESDI